MKFGPVVQKMSFKEKVYAQTDGRPTKTNHNSSGELKTINKQYDFVNPTCVHLLPAASLFHAH